MTASLEKRLGVAEFEPWTSWFLADSAKLYNTIIAKCEICLGNVNKSNTVFGSF